jgi:hypothetical protein
MLAGCRVLRVICRPFRKLASLQALHQDLEEQLQVLATAPGDNQSTVARLKVGRLRAGAQLPARRSTAGPSSLQVACTASSPQALTFTRVRP